MDDLARWLGTQLDEDEQAARACSGMEWREHPKNWVSAPPSNRIAVVVHDGDRGHIVRHDPARVLREINAKRQMLDRYEELRAASKEEGLIGDVTEEYQNFLLRLLALPYADRSGYREEWAP